MLFEMERKNYVLFFHWRTPRTPLEMEVRFPGPGKMFYAILTCRILGLAWEGGKISPKKKLAIVAAAAAAIIIVAVGLATLEPKSKPQSVNELPVARFVYDADNLTVVFNASASSDPDGEIVNYSWTFGDDTVGDGKVVTHVYPRNGTYETELTVTDDKGGKNKTSKKVMVKKTVGPAASNPVAVIDIVDIEDLTVTLSGSDSYDPDGGSITTYAWSFSDGATATGEEVEHEFAASGTYTVTLTVTDDEGATGSTSVDVTVPSKPPPPPPPHPEGPPGLLHAIEIHIDKLAANPDNHGLQNSLDHLQLNLDRWLDKHGGQEEGKGLGNGHGNGNGQGGL